MMEMRTITILIALTMLTTGLAGCTGGDPDGGGNDEFDAETLQGMIEAGLQDFMNNTTVEITNNYYTNSTSQYNVNGSSGMAASLHGMAGNAAGVSFAEGVAMDTLELGVNLDMFHDATSALHLDGARVCLEVGSAVESSLAYYYELHGMQLTVVNAVSQSAGFAFFNAGACGVIVHDPALSGSLLDETAIPNFISFEIAGEDYSTIYASSTLNLTIHQEEGSAIDLIDLYGEVTLSGWCVTNCTEEDEDYSLTFSTTSPRFQDGFHSMTAYCEYNLTSTLWYWDEPDYDYPPIFPGPGKSSPPGLSCDLEIELTFSNNDGFGGADRYEWSWSDWTYFVHWESTPVTMH